MIELCKCQQVCSSFAKSAIFVTVACISGHKCKFLDTTWHYDDDDDDGRKELAQRRRRLQQEHLENAN